jgi:hypothetical protein
LSRIPADLLRKEEHYNLYRRPPKEKQSERPKVIVWKPNATHQADLAEMPVDPKGFHYFLVIVKLACRRVDAKPLKDKTAERVLNGFVKIYRRGCIKPPTHRLEVDSSSEFTNEQVCDFFLNSLGSIKMLFSLPHHWPIWSIKPIDYSSLNCFCCFEVFPMYIILKGFLNYSSSLSILIKEPISWTDLMMPFLCLLCLGKIMPKI